MEKQPLTRYRWEEIDYLLLYATTAPDQVQKWALLRKVREKTGISTSSLSRRLKRLHIQHFPPLYAGPDAIEKYETEFKAILNAIKSRERLYRLILPSMANKSGVSVEDLAERLGIQVRAMREKPNRVLSITEAASMLHVRKSAIIAWVRDLELLKADERGGIRLQELRRFVTSESRWLLPMAKNIVCTGIVKGNSELLR